MKKLHSYLMLLVLAVGLLPSALPMYTVHAQEEPTEVVLQPDGTSMKDTYLANTSPTTNYGTQDLFTVGERNDVADNKRRSILEFDLSGLPFDMTVVSATLTLTVYGDYSSNTRTMQAYPILEEWVEDQATWNKRRTSPSNDWQVAGASGENDVGSTIGSVSVASDLAVDTEVTITLDPEAVQAMARQNYFGFKLQMDTETDDAYQFYSSDNASTTKRPKLTIEYYPDTPVPDPGWICYDGMGPNTTNWPDCDDPSPPVESPYLAGGQYTQDYLVDWANVTAATLNCDPWPRCQNDFPVHYRVAFTADWVAAGSMDSEFHIKFYNNNGSAHVVIEDITMDCGVGTSGSCYGVVEGIIDESMFPVNADGGYTVGLMLDFEWEGLWPVTEKNVAWNLEMSLSPFDQSCADSYYVPVPDTYTIDPTIETPQGDPIDDQIYETVISAIYMVHVQDGPWNDGTDDRTDAAFSVDGVFWHSWADAELFLDVVCIDTQTNRDYDVIYFEATHEEFWIRVDDTAGNFADNTNDEETPFSYEIGVAFENPEAVSCESQFSYDEVNDWEASVVIQGTEDGTLANNDFLTIGDWYAIEVESGTWDDNGVGDYIDMEYIFSGDVDYPDVYTDLNEDAPHVWCVSSDGMTVFIQAPAEYLSLRVNDKDNPYNFSDNSGALNVNIYHASFERTISDCEVNYDHTELVNRYEVAGNQSEGVSFATYPTQYNLVYYHSGEPMISIPTGEEFLVPGGTYAIETLEGPWWSTVTSGDVVANTHYFNMEIKVGDADWEPLETWSGASCIAETDTIGHVIVYFQVPEDTAMAEDTYSLRVAANLFMLTRGDMAFNLYGAADYGYEGVSGNCDDYILNDEVEIGGVIESNSEQGTYISGYESFLDPEFIAIRINSDQEVEDPPYFAKSGWYEQVGAGESDAVQFSRDGGETWTALPDAPGVMCYYYTPVSDELVIFVRNSMNTDPKLRVDSETFSNNVGREYYTVYPASPNESLDTNLWESCIGDHSEYLPPINPHEWIDVEQEYGELIRSLDQYAEKNGMLPEGAESPPEIFVAPGNEFGWYFLEVEYGTGPWTDGEAGEHYNVELSNNGGVSWEELDADTSIVECTTVDPFKMYWKALIHVETPEDPDEWPQAWRIRVADEADAFGDNGGSLGYVLYSAAGFEVPPSDNSNIGFISVGGVDVCDMAPVFPTVLEEISIDALGNYLGGWFEYVNVSIARYLAYCPRHTDMLFSLIDIVMKKEPFATMAEFGSLENDLKRELSGYGWEGEDEDLSFIWGTKTPSQIQALVNEYVFEGGTNDPWADDGQLLGDDFGEGTALPSSYNTCRALLPDYKRFADGLCFASSMMKETSAQFWIQLGFDVMFFFMVIGTITGSIKNFIAMATGVARTDRRTDVNVTVERQKR